MKTGIYNDGNVITMPLPPKKEGNKMDNVNHPKHYTQGNVECIDALAAATINLQGLEAVCTANAIKYLWRWKNKNGVEDLQKAKWYIDKMINTSTTDSALEVDLNITKWHEGKEEMPKDCYIIVKQHDIVEPILCFVDKYGNISDTYSSESVERDEIEYWYSVNLNF